MLGGAVSQACRGGDGALWLGAGANRLKNRDFRAVVVQ